jgi:hypothetical protein
MISLYYAGQIYNVDQEPFETTEDSYKRAWYIVKNYGKYAYDSLYSMSIMMLNKECGMQYDNRDLV